MTTAQILMLAAEALTYDAVVVLWVTRRGTQPVLMPRSLGRHSARGHGPSETETTVPRSKPWTSAARGRSGT